MAAKETGGVQPVWLSFIPTWGKKIKQRNSSEEDMRKKHFAAAFSNQDLHHSKA